MHEPTPIDAPLIEALAAWRSGDPAGFESLYRRCFGRVREIVRVRMGSELRAGAESLDIVQDVFLGLARTAPPEGVASEPEFIAYLAVAVENRLRDLAKHARREKRERARERSLEDLRARGFDAGAAQPSPSQVAMGAEEYERYLAAVAGLPEREREAIVLARHAGYSSAQAAAILELADGASFRSLLHRALGRAALEMQRRV